MDEKLNAPGSGAEEHSLLLDALRIAALLGISRSSLYKLVSSGRAPRPIKIGRSVRWRREEIEDWVRAGAPPLSRWKWSPPKR